MLKHLLWVVGFLLACAAAVGVRLDHVHGETGEWRMRPAADPGVLRYDGRVYDRVGPTSLRQTGFVKRGVDLGGADIFAPRSHVAPWTLQVRNGVQHFYDYRLAG